MITLDTSVRVGRGSSESVDNLRALVLSGNSPAYKYVGTQGCSFDPQVIPSPKKKVCASDDRQCIVYVLHQQAGECSFTLLCLSHILLSYKSVGLVSLPVALHLAEENNVVADGLSRDSSQCMNGP